MLARTVRPIVAVALLAACWAPTAARAQDVGTTPTRSWLYSVRGGSFTTGGMGFLGGGAALPLSERFLVEGSGEWLLAREIDRMFMLSADVHYDMPMDGRAQAWLGTGIGIRHFAKGNGWPPEHSLGLNLLGGFGLPTGGRLLPFVQAKVFLAGETLFANDTEAVLLAGLRF